VAERDELLQRARERGWYHTLELGAGVTTDGWFDLRSQVKEYKLPDRLDGLRCLEVGTWDGFWAFELEDRGAAEVVALDLDEERELDWPPRRRPETFPAEPRGDGFRLAAQLRGSRARRVVCSIYDALPAEHGQFDLVFCSAVLIHLRDQLLALERMADLLKPGGRLVLAEEHDKRAGLVPWPVSRLRIDEGPAVVFWSPSARTWRRMVSAAGFDDVREAGRFTMRGKGVASPHVVIHATKR